MKCSLTCSSFQACKKDGKATAGTNDAKVLTTTVVKVTAKITKNIKKHRTRNMLMSAYDAHTTMNY